MKPFEMKTAFKDASIFTMFLRGEVYKQHLPLDIEIAVTDEPVKFCDRLSLNYSKFNVGDKWSNKLFNCGWMHLRGDVPSDKDNAEKVLIIDVSGEGCLFDNNGTPIRGLTNVASQFERRLGLPGKTTLFLNEIKPINNKIDIWVEIGDNDLFGASTGGFILSCHTGYLFNNVRDLYYDLTFLLDYIEALDDKNPQYYSILYCVQDAIACVSSEYKNEEILEAREILNRELSKKNGENTFLTFYSSGHAHLDLAWLWPIRETKRKLGRTFSNVVANMEKYPEYLFGASQAQQFEWLEEYYPELFKKVADKVKCGAIELEGGMWVESDTNLTGGESLIRQFVYGKNYFKDKFNKDIKICHLPDAFGFSGALPQIMKKCGIDYFLTIKITWSEHFEFPHHTFVWEGVDGSRVLAHIPPEGNYNSPASPKIILEAQGKFVERGKLDKAVMLYGIGDGGGGPGRDHLERMRRAENFVGLPMVEQRHLIEFFEETKKDAHKLSVFKGEMYLDRHQGTLTSVSENKKFNRLTENALLTAEKMLIAAKLNGDNEYPKEHLDKLWKETLLYQFHDILPGSSIKRVYDESQERYTEMLGEISSITSSAASTQKGEELCVFNPCSFERVETVIYNGKSYCVEAQPLSYTKLGNEAQATELICSERMLENKYLRAEFDLSGAITSLLDKTNNKNSILGGNNLRVYNEFLDCWDMTANFKKYHTGDFKLVSRKAYTLADAAIIEQKFTFNLSELTQKIILKNDAKILEFDCKLNWKETKKMLRVCFQPAIKSDKAVCDIQFASIERPTASSTIEQYGKYEVSMHKYVDVSSRDYGLAVINDCKYACNVKDDEISVNLIRSQMYPCENSDKGEHVFKYALYPHSGDSYQSDVVKISTAFNNPMNVHKAKATAPILKLTGDNIMVETVKRAERSDDIIVRLYETRKSSAATEITLPFSAKIVTECDMMENDLTENILSGGKVELAFEPFEIKTIKIKI